VWEGESDVHVSCESGARECGSRGRAARHQRQHSDKHEGVIGKRRRHAEGTSVLIVPLRGRVRAHHSENNGEMMSTRATGASNGGNGGGASI